MLVTRTVIYSVTKNPFQLQHHLVAYSWNIFGEYFYPLSIQCLNPWSMKASCSEPEWRRSLKTGLQPTDRTRLDTAAAIVSEWVTDRLRWKQLSSRSPVYSPSDSCTCADTITHTSEGRRAAKAPREWAPRFLERLDGGMTEWQMSQPPSGGISVPLTLIHWHTSVSRRLNAIALIYGPVIDPLTPKSKGIGWLLLLLLLLLFLFPLPPASLDKSYWGREDGQYWFVLTQYSHFNRIPTGPTTRPRVESWTVWIISFHPV